jgi:D-alanyl-D-alanine carboxypeptidase
MRILEATGMLQFFGARKPSRSLPEQLDAMLSRCFAPDDAGAAIIVTKGGETLFRAAYGLADIKRNITLDPGATFRLGSLTKQFTAVGIMLLAERGKLSLQQDIRELLPDYPTQGKIVTIEHLLAHTSGIRDFARSKDFKETLSKDVSVDALIDAFKNAPLQFEPGSKFAYSNSNYFLLGAIIERLACQSYASFMAYHIFEPLELHDTAYEGYERRPAPRARGYSHRKPAAPVSMTRPYAAGALVSTVDDLARWDAAISAGKLLSAQSWERAFAPFKLNNGRQSTYAYGWGVLRLGPFRTFEHGGAIPGFVTHAIRVPEVDLFVAVLANDDGGDQNILNLLRVLWHGRVPAMLAGRATKAAIVAERAAARA